MSQIRVRLKMVVFDIDFRKSEDTNMSEFKKSRNYPGDLKKGEVFLFVSKSRNLLRWIVNESEISAYSKTTALHSWLTRIRNGTWHDWLLADWAEEVGLELVGIKKFEQRYKEYLKKRSGKKSKKNGKITHQAA